jgi:hypothetical protein
MSLEPHPTLGNIDKQHMGNAYDHKVRLCRYRKDYLQLDVGCSIDTFSRMTVPMLEVMLRCTVDDQILVQDRGSSKHLIKQSNFDHCYDAGTRERLDTLTRMGLQ